jgi:hypothetical protein
MWMGSCYILVAENLSKNKYLRIELNFDQSKKVASSRGELNTVDYVPPRHRQLLHGLIPFNIYGGYQITISNKTFKLKNTLLTKLAMLNIFNKTEKKLIELHTPRKI